MPNRFIDSKDIDTFDKYNKELVGNLTTNQDGIINQIVVVYKIAVNDTEVNMYGEAGKGKIYKPGVRLACIVSAEDMAYSQDEYGPDLRQDATFSFIKQALKDLSFVVDIGDIIDWNSGYWEVSSLNENQLVAGQSSNSHSIICNAFLARVSNLNIEEVRSI